MSDASAAGYPMEGAAYPMEGAPAPDFTLSASGGRKVRLGEFRGKRNVVLFFYPKDMTSGCTREACGFRDRAADLKMLDTVVLGISPDPVKQHEKFVEKHGLNFPLLADEDRAVAKAYGAWRVQNKLGQEYAGVARTTLVIDKKGNVAKLFADVKPEGHAEEVRDWIAEHLVG